MPRPVDQVVGGGALSRRRWPGRWIDRLPVGRKLLLIYLLDMTAVIYISGLLIHEKLSSIDFTRKEVAGSHYMAMVRETLYALPTPGEGAASPRAPESAEALTQQVWRAEADHGAHLDSAELAARYARALQASLERPDDLQRQVEALQAARRLLTRVGNQSNLILDPDLDSYYTMSLVLLRFPQLHDLLEESMRPAAAGDTDLAGRFDAATASTLSDYDEAISAAAPALKTALGTSRAALSAALSATRPGAGPAPALLQADAAVRDAWRLADRELQALLAARLHRLYMRMWLHLGTAVALLGVILAVVYSVATSISRPLRQLAAVAGNISRSGDHAVRATIEGAGEIGQLVTSFNRMLGDLARDRETRQELAATTRAEAAQRTLVEAFPTPLIVTSIPDHRVLHANPPAGQWLDGLHTDPWITCLDPAARLRYFQRLSDVGSADGFEVLWRTREGYRWALLSGRRLAYRGEDALLTTITPINQIKLLEQRLELWSKVFEASSEGIMILDAERRLLSVNQAFVRMTGWEGTEVLGKSPDFLYCRRHEPSFYEALWAAMVLRGGWRGETWFLRKNGEMFPSWLVANAVRNQQGHVTHFVLAASDISDHKANEERIAHLAHHDALTDLPNRALFLERLRLALQQATRDDSHVAVVYIDLDRFKHVNDSHGHHVGDALLRSVAKRLVQAVRMGDTVCRLGGDEFIVVLNRIGSVEEVRTIVVDRIVAGLRLPHMLDGITLEVPCSAGVAIYPLNGRDTDHLMHNADAAMYHAKASGKNQAVFYTAELHAQAQQRLALERGLLHAADLGEISLQYQPRVDARTGHVVGVEALARWTSPIFGTVSPEQFIAVAEESGQIIALGAWIVDEACRQHGAWRDDGTGRVPVSVNLSMAQLRDVSLVDMIQSALVRHAVEPGAFEIELTESLLMENAIATVDILQRIKRLGVRMSIDDFGTGYSSLNYLHQFPIDKLKIDQSFVRNMAQEPADLAITRAIIGLGHSLGLKVVAEGVEQADVERLLAEAGCDELQGYLYSPALSAFALSRWLAGRTLAGPDADAAAGDVPRLPAPAAAGVAAEPLQLTHG